MKTSMIIVLTIFTISVANAGSAENKIQSINSWIENEKSQTIKFQKVKWQEGKAQTANTIAKVTKQVRPIKIKLKGFGDAFFKALDGNLIERKEVNQ